MNDIVDRLRSARTDNQTDDDCYEAAAEIESLRGSLEEWKLDLDSMRNQLEASQAREAQMRTEMEKIADWHGSWGPFPENNEAWRSMVVVTARQATKLPTDDTALKARLKAERERCAKAFSQWDRDGRWAAGVIRNLGDE